jgi:hypothetical protein
MSFLSNIKDSVNTSLPEFENLDEGIDYIVKNMELLSKDLSEEDFYLNKRWLEVRDDHNFKESILHIFKANGEYLRILNGDIDQGNWEQNVGGFIIKYANRHELYESVFLNDNFFVLKKHGNQNLNGSRKYFFLVKENFAGNKEWDELLESMYGVYKGNINYLLAVAVIVLVIAVFIYFSIF